MRLATTTSTNDSGLLDAILADFEREFNARVDVVAVGTGQAIELGKAGDADIILVHSRAREDAFVAEGHGTARYDVMYNDFVIVGPVDDPAAIAGTLLASDAFTAVASPSRRLPRAVTTAEPTRRRYRSGSPPGCPGFQFEWYKSLGQGMGATLNYSNEAGAYTLTDRGTFLSQSESLPELASAGRRRVD